MTPKELAILAAKALDGKKGEEIKVMEVTDLTTLADYFVIYRGGIWVLLDYGCLVVHVFNSEAREFYGLERLWSDGKSLDLEGLLAQV